MSGVAFDESGLRGPTDVAKNIVVGIADLLEIILSQVFK
jgi:hypothetical protein